MREPQRLIRVAYIIQNLNYGGMERLLHSLAKRLPARGFEVHVVVLEYYGQFARGLEETATLHQAPPMSRLSLLYPRHLARMLQAIGPDVVHSHTGVWLKGAHAARLAGVPVTVHTEHGRPDPVPLADRLIDNRASRWTDVTIAVSDALADVLRRQVVHDPSRVRVITNGVDTTRLRPPEDRSALRHELGIPEADLVIGSIGRLEPVKNFRLALDGFARLGARLGNGQTPWLVLVGDGSERQALERHAIELDVASRVKFLGWRPDAERIYGTFDLFTLTSLSEGTSISLLEAMSSEVCPIVTDVGGNRAVLGSDLDSLLVPSREDTALANAWHRQLIDPTGRATLGRRARQRVEEEFSLDRMIEQHIALYHELVNR
jgi:glycosyltransferase involved in cell wall biosynthesis